MTIEINKLFEMLNWNNDKKTQEKGIEEGKKIKYISIFIQPIEDKGVWENCAKIIADKSDEILQPYVYFLLEWLQDANWPGFDIIYNRITSMSSELIISEYSYSIKKAKKLEDEMWLTYLIRLDGNKQLYERLSQKEKKIINKHLLKKI